MQLADYWPFPVNRSAFGMGVPGSDITHSAAPTITFPHSPMSAHMWCELNRATWPGIITPRYFAGWVEEERLIALANFATSSSLRPCPFFYLV